MAQQTRQGLDGSPSPVIGIVGDRNPSYQVHAATEAALGHLLQPLPFEWIPTDQIPPSPGPRLSRYAGLLISPGSPYRNMDGVLETIRYAREGRVPLLGTCGGFQHIVVEFARNVLGIRDADHQETNPEAPRLVVTALSCSLAGQNHLVRPLAGSRAAALYGVSEILEPFYCSYGLNPEFRPLLEARGLTVSGLGDDGQARIIELADHPFFFGTLYVPQARSRPGKPHPLLVGFGAAARKRMKETA